MLSYANPYCFTEPNKNYSIIILIPLKQYGGHSWGVKRQLTIQTNPVRSQVYSYEEPALPNCSGRCCASDGVGAEVKWYIGLTSPFTIFLAWFYPKQIVLILLSPYIVARSYFFRRWCFYLYCSLLTALLINKFFQSSIKLKYNVVFQLYFISKGSMYV